MYTIKDQLQTEIDQIRHSGLYKTERIITTPQQAEISTAQTTGSVLNFCANNYLMIGVMAFRRYGLFVALKASIRF